MKEVKMEKFLTSSRNMNASSEKDKKEDNVAPDSISIDIKKCTPKSFVDSALEGVPSDNMMDTLQQLLQLTHGCTNYLNELVKSESKRLVVDLSNESGKSEPCSAESILYQTSDGSFIEPRGKFSATVRVNGLLLEGKSGHIFLPWSQVRMIIYLPNPLSSKKEGEMLLFFILREPIDFGKRQLKIVCWNLNQVKNAKELQASYGPLHFKGTEANVISNLISALVSLPLVVPDNSIFRTSKGTNFLKCYKGVQEGTLYPLKEGVLFFKPPIFIPSNEVASIMAGRGGSAQTRYIDLNIDTEGNKTFEFSNIDRDDLPAIQQYVQYYVELRRKEEKRERRDMTKISDLSGGNSSDIVQVEDSDDSDAESDEDFDPDADDSELDEEGESSSSSESECGRSTSKDDASKNSSSKWEKLVEIPCEQSDEDSDDNSVCEESDESFESCSGDEVEVLHADLTVQETVATSSKTKRRRTGSSISSVKKAKVIE